MRQGQVLLLAGFSTIPIVPSLLAGTTGGCTSATTAALGVILTQLARPDTLAITILHLLSI